MKKTARAKRRRAAADDLEPDYRFDYRKARPNRFAARMAKDRLVVVVEPDIAKVFQTPESINKALRALIEALPKNGARGR